MNNIPTKIHGLPVQHLNQRTILVGYQPTSDRAVTKKVWDDVRENGTNVVAEIAAQVGGIDTIVPITGYVDCMVPIPITIGYLIILSA